MNVLYGYALALLIGAFGAWYVEALRWDKDVTGTANKLAEERTQQASKVSNDLLVSWAQTETMRAQFIEYKEGSKLEIAKLEHAVAAGTSGLRVNATCTPTVQASGTDAKRTDAGTAELNPAARSDYYALRKGLSDQYALLTLCRATLILRSKQNGG